jgi:hypothetical protein
MTARVIGLDLSVAATGLAKPDGTTVTIRPPRRRRRPRPTTQRDRRPPRPLPPPRRRPGRHRGLQPGRARRPLRHAPPRRGRRRRPPPPVRARHPVHRVSPIAAQEVRGRLWRVAAAAGDEGRHRGGGPAGGVSAANDNEADAFWLHAMGRSEYSETWEPAYRSAELLDVRAQVRASIRWPALEVHRGA